MKKIFVIKLILILSISLYGCKINNNSESSSEKNQIPTVVESEKNIDDSEDKSKDSEVNNNSQNKKEVVSEKDLNTKQNDWYNMRSNNHETPGIHNEASPWLSKYNSMFVGDTSKKIFHFTFDAGSDNGYANEILDILKEQQVKATFFLTKPYITQNPQIAKRIVEEGHVAANHTVNHLAMPKLTNEKLKEEIEETASEFKKITGSDMAKFVRPPMGAYSEKTLYLTDKLGYKTVFWSIAYEDYNDKNPPSNEKAISLIKNNYHNGAVLLLHINCKTNADTLKEMIVFLKEKGYSFDVIS